VLLDSWGQSNLKVLLSDLLELAIELTLLVGQLLTLFSDLLLSTFRNRGFSSCAAFSCDLIISQSLLLNNESLKLLIDLSDLGFDGLSCSLDFISLLNRLPELITCLSKGKEDRFVCTS